MNGMHDMGGRHGMGPVITEENEPVFHEEWERRMAGIMVSTFAGGYFNVDQLRRAEEETSAAGYLNASYYELWMRSVESHLYDHGAITREELDALHQKLINEEAA